MYRRHNLISNSLPQSMKTVQLVVTTPTHRRRTVILRNNMRRPFRWALLLHFRLRWFTGINGTNGSVCATAIKVQKVRIKVPHSKWRELFVLSSQDLAEKHEQRETLSIESFLPFISSGKLENNNKLTLDENNTKTALPKLFQESCALKSFMRANIEWLWSGSVSRLWN